MEVKVRRALVGASDRARNYGLAPLSLTAIAGPHRLNDEAYTAVTASRRRDVARAR